MLLDNLAAMTEFPRHVGAALGRRGCYIDLFYDSMHESLSFRAFEGGSEVDLGSIGTPIGYYLEGAVIAIARASNGLKGHILMHELGHAVDFDYVYGIGAMLTDGTVPTDALDEAGWWAWTFSLSSAVLSDHPTVDALWDDAKANTIPARFNASVQEWFAEMFACSMARRVSGNSGGNITSAVNSITGSDSTILDAFDDFLEAVYIF